MTNAVSTLGILFSRNASTNLQNDVKYFSKVSTQAFIRQLFTLFDDDVILTIWFIVLSAFPPHNENQFRRKFCCSRLQWNAIIICTIKHFGIRERSAGCGFRSHLGETFQPRNFRFSRTSVRQQQTCAVVRANLRFRWPIQGSGYGWEKAVIRGTDEFCGISAYLKSEISVYRPLWHATFKHHSLNMKCIIHKPIVIIAQFHIAQ